VEEHRSRWQRSRSHRLSPQTEADVAAPAVLKSLAMAAKKTSKKPTKSSFIRQHPDLSAADVIAKGKAEGMKFTSSLVYMVRGRQDGKKSAAKGLSSPKKAAAKKASAASKPVSPKTATTNKADFVRQRGHLSPNTYEVTGSDREVVSSREAAPTRSGTMSPFTAG
jgi:hypothetical protein